MNQLKSQLTARRQQVDKQLEAKKQEMRGIQAEITTLAGNLLNRQSRLQVEIKQLEAEVVQIQVEAIMAGCGCQELCAHQFIEKNPAGGRNCCICNALIMMD